MYTERTAHELGASRHGAEPTDPLEGDALKPALIDWPLHLRDGKLL